MHPNVNGLIVSEMRTAAGIASSPPIVTNGGRRLKGSESDDESSIRTPTDNDDETSDRSSSHSDRSRGSDIIKGECNYLSI